MQELLAELGFYGLGGAPESPRALIDEVRDAEELGLGALFISERFDLKEAVTLSGAAPLASVAASRPFLTRWGCPASPPPSSRTSSA
jgi:hypothetical protein